MISTSNLIQNEITHIVESLYGLNDMEFKIEHPANESFGDYACNVALVLSKQLKQSPMEIAKAVSYRISESPLVKEHPVLISSVSIVAPGFINMKISDIWLRNLLTEVLERKNTYGSCDLGKGFRIALEHSNVNPNKAAHVGHLRNACVGQFLERVYEFLGYDVEVQYYANNVGVQVATSNMGLTRIRDISPAPYKKFDHYAWDVYAAMESQINQSEELKESRQQLLKKLEDPTSPEFKTQKELADKILLEQLKTFSSLNIDYDVVIYESDILNLKMWEKAFAYLKSNPNVYKATEGASEGCWLVKMGDEQVSASEEQGRQGDQIEKDKIIVRSNGIPTYTGKDIAYHMWKFGLLDLDFNYKPWDTGTQTKTLWRTTSDAADRSDISFSNVNFVFDVIGMEQTYAMEAVKK
ncbi:arginine--tRNA ligase [candidate division WWE3 bacterium]|uniref:Arginine--tRNA ligase n=1 Tax=candidate division WWE3 bacterium TaxID=2053526 RepID=A0A7X9DKB7_UNCKA|nr:arginine--tRNA ligase [candidate division WWE3 bacterium]